MNVSVNGTSRDLPEELTIAGLLETFQIHPKSVVVEHNLEIVDRPKWNEVVLHAGDVVEIVQMMAGG